MSAEQFLLLVGLVAAIGWLALVAVRRWRQWRIARLMQKPLAAQDIAMLNRWVYLYPKLPPELRQRLNGLVQVFLHEKVLVGRGGQQITRQVELVVAANACLLILGRQTHRFPAVLSVLLYPDTYSVPVSDYDGYLVQDSIETRAGEAWYRGPVVLSWQDALRGSKAGDGFNVIIHEFAHKLDEENSLMDGLPVLASIDAARQWNEVLSHEYEQFLAGGNRAQQELIDPYGATSPVEFFAVVTESFFERGAEFHQQLPDLYRQLALYYNLDPASWGDPSPQR